MIEITSKKLKQTDELERASKNLPSNLIIQAYTEHSNLYMIYDFDIDFIFVPYGADKIVTPRDIVFYNQKATWVNPEIGPGFKICSNLNLDNIDEVTLLYMEKIPKTYEFVDLHIQNYHEKRDFMKVCCLEFLQDTLETLFSYRFEQKSTFSNLSCGTFARVSDGWKFYPKFEPYEGDANDMFQKYLWRDCDDTE